MTAKTDKEGKVHDVRKAPYNAKGDGITLDTEAIQSAIDACEDNDVVLIPEEYTFLTGALDLKSNMTLEVNGTLLSSKNASDFEKKIDDSKHIQAELQQVLYIQKKHQKTYLEQN